MLSIKKICPICKGTGSVTTNKYIPKGKKKYISEETTGGWNGTNESGFTGLPVNYRGGWEIYGDFGDDDIWWSSTEYLTYFAWYRGLNSYNGSVNRGDNSKRNGLSVRCLRD